MNDLDAIRALNRIEAAATALARVPGGYADGVRALRFAAADNLRASSSQPGGPASVLDDQGVPMPAVSDPTGETVVRNAAAAARVDELDGHLRTALDAMTAAHAIVEQALAPHRARPAAPANEGPAHGACRSCWRADGYYEPVSHYRHYCRWCGDFTTNHGIKPPVELLDKRHRGIRISQRDVDEALARAGAKAS